MLSVCFGKVQAQGYEKLMPEDFIAGFAHVPGPCSEDMGTYGIFLIKDSEGYQVVLNRLNDEADDASASILTSSARIDKELADKMAESFPSYYFNVQPADGQSAESKDKKDNRSVFGAAP